MKFSCLSLLILAGLLSLTTALHGKYQIVQIDGLKPSSQWGSSLQIKKVYPGHPPMAVVSYCNTMTMDLTQRPNGSLKFGHGKTTLMACIMPEPTYMTLGKMLDAVRTESQGDCRTTLLKDENGKTVIVLKRRN